MITGGEAGAAFTWTITSSGGGQVSGSGVMSAASTRVDGLNLSGLGDGTLTVALHLTNPAGNASPPFSATTQKLIATPDEPAPASWRRCRPRPNCWSAPVPRPGNETPVWAHSGGQG